MEQFTWKHQPIPAPAATQDPATADFSLGDLTVVPGGHGEGLVALGTTADGKCTGIRFAAKHGAYSGPVVVLQAGVHGDEYDGQEAVRRMISEIDPATLRGTVVAIPCLNEAGFEAAARTSAVDHANMNRIYPGSPTGTLTDRLADLYVREIVSAADAMVDLHTGGAYGQIAPLAIVQRGYEELAIALGLAAGNAVVWKGGKWGGTARSAFLEAGKPAVTLEFGGGRYEREVMEHHLASLRNILRAFGMIDGHAVYLDRYTQVDATFAHAEGGGFYVAEVEPGDVVERGTVLARIVGHLGEVRETVTAEEDGLTVWVRRRCTVNIGEETIIFGRIEGEIVVT
ncbi:succinylglutamate desuccinylase/aspartoacylase family protein [Glycomyces tenuis]|uniref:succinylglutamate desuccinylase/aspartoacylase family protein n=1 Tax=Glycomyces tenuis TaxID=58116 RepID=UPI0004051717|nr:succinylglutamate desuccinylase/aspartoacylase family protein [Glycomyces tenuis]